VARILSSHNLPANGARKLFKPSEEAESLLALILKNLGTFGFELFWCDARIWGGHVIFG